MKKTILAFLVLILIISLCSCLTDVNKNAAGLSESSENKTDVENYRLDQRVDIDKISWPDDGATWFMMPNNSDSFSEDSLKNRIARLKYRIPVWPCEDDGKICMMVLPSVNGEFDRYSVFDLKKLPEEGYDTFLHIGIVRNLMKEKNTDLYDKYERYIASGKSGYYPTDEEYAAFSALYNECLDIALKDERWIEMCEDYDRAYSKNLEVKKERLGKVDWTAEEKFFLDLGFELAAVYSDDGDFGEYLTGNEVPFAVAGTKKQFEDLFENVLDETGRAQSGTVYRLEFSLNPSTAGKHMTLMEMYSGKIPATLAEAEALEEDRKALIERLRLYAP